MDLAALYSEPFFFQAIRTGDIQATQENLRERETERLKEELETLSAAADRMRRFNEMQGRQEISVEQQAERQADEELLNQLRPQWLKWNARDEAQQEIADLAGKPEATETLAKETAIAELPEVLARFDNGHPYLVKRRIGQGQVVLATSGIKPEWNTLATTDAMLLFDRLLRGMLNETIERRTFITQENIPFPLVGNTSNLEFELQRPAAGGKLPEPEPLNVGFIGARTRGLTIHNALHQGIYTITAYKPVASADRRAPRAVAWQTSLAVNVDNSADVSESDLQPLTRQEFEDRLAGEEVPITWVSATDSISLDGVTIRGQNLWMWLAFVVLLLLLVEISVLAWPTLKAASAAGAESSSALGNETSTARAT